MDVTLCYQVQQCWQCLAVTAAGCIAVHARPSSFCKVHDPASSLPRVTTRQALVIYVAVFLLTICVWLLLDVN